MKYVAYDVLIHEYVIYDDITKLCSDYAIDEGEQIIEVDEVGNIKIKVVTKEVKLKDKE